MILEIPDILLGFFGGMIIGILLLLIVGWYYNTTDEDKIYYEFNDKTKETDNKDINDNELTQAVKEFVDEYYKKK